jgi:hypothetical protein
MAMQNRRTDQTARQLEHNGFLVHACPTQLAEDGRWSLGITIEHRDRQHASASYGSVRTTCGTEWEATLRSLDFGKRVIEGEFPKLRLP